MRITRMFSQKMVLADRTLIIYGVGNESSKIIIAAPSGNEKSQELMSKFLTYFGKENFMNHIVYNIFRVIMFDICNCGNIDIDIFIICRKFGYILFKLFLFTYVPRAGLYGHIATLTLGISIWAPWPLFS